MSSTSNFINFGECYFDVEQHCTTSCLIIFCQFRQRSAPIKKRYTVQNLWPCRYEQLTNAVQSIYVVDARFRWSELCTTHFAEETNTHVVCEICIRRCTWTDRIARRFNCIVSRVSIVPSN